MRTVYALFVGIDDYPGRHRLRGCVNDVREAESWLRRQTRTLTPVVKTLHDGEASRAAVPAAVERHPGQCGPDDTALFWFSGHGSEYRTDDPREATGWAQALVCQDSLGPGGQPMLQDSEL
ncbi:caspase family protein [Streptomyces sp. NBC_00663]|uniref:caspase family protein n=1 Tax=Streptomyces sp. NBC_00663 TaxID=2975801 RepID=UPI002E2F2221|nr:caspase family protein [Streptomyces sp. NBC_00663]